MKILFRSALGLAALALIASCSTAVDIVDNSTKADTGSTKKLMVELPKSLTASVAVSGSMSRALAPSSIGYTMIQSTVASAKSFVPFMAQYGALIDAVVSQNNLSPSSTTVSGKALTITQAMVDQMKASVDADMLNPASLPPVNSTMPMPDFVYNTSANSKFAYSFTTDMSDNSPMTFYWNADKSKVGIEMSMAGMMSMTVANDTATQSTMMKIVSTGGTFTMRFKSDEAASATHGVFVGMDVEITGQPTMVITGWADDNGGAVAFAMGAGSYTEEFTGLGLMSYQAFDTTVLYDAGGNGATAAYTGKLGNTSWGDASTFF